MNKIAVVAVSLLALGQLSSAQADTVSGSFQVTATVLKSCTVNALPLSFGNITPGTADVNAESSVTVTCTNGTPYNVGLDVGKGVGATVGQRYLTGPTAGGTAPTMAYTIYKDTGRTQIWGNTVNTDTVAKTGTGSADVLTTYGKIAKSQFVAAGSYTDTIGVTVSY
jgi:spore coat protein U-like protein